MSKLKLHLLGRLVMGHFMNFSCVVNSSQQQFAVEIVRALQTGNVDNISVNVDAKPKHYLVLPMGHNLSVEFYTCMQVKY